MNLITQLEKLGYKANFGAYTRQKDDEFSVVTDIEGALPDHTTLRFYLGVYPSKRAFEAGEMPGDSGISAFTIVPGSLLKLQLAHGGALVADLIFEINEGLTIPAAPEVAKLFCMNVSEAVPPDVIERIWRENQLEPAGRCVTYRYTDANQHMIDAFSDLTGEDPNRDDELIERIWNEAWQIARDCGFDQRKLMLPPDYREEDEEGKSEC